MKLYTILQNGLVNFCIVKVVRLLILALIALMCFEFLPAGIALVHATEVVKTTAPLPQKNRKNAQTKSQPLVDAELADRLRSDLDFDLTRRKAFSDHHDENKIFDKEREQGLSLFLEEDERWNRLREKGVEEHRASRVKPMDENSPEYFADLAEKEKMEADLERARELHVRTKRALVEEFEAKIPQSEEKELGIVMNRPRFELRARGKNKWLNAGKKLMGSGGGGGSSSFDLPPMPAPGGDYVPPPQDNFEDIPPPPPPVPYDPTFDNPPGFDSGFGDIPPPPPPPPTDPSWDF